MKVKIFTSQGDALKLQEEINQRLSEKNVSISYSHEPGPPAGGFHDYLYCPKRPSG